jgi:hypothetical protein
MTSDDTCPKCGLTFREHIAPYDCLTAVRAKLHYQLDLARAHIGWCWDLLEENTRLRREGSRGVHEAIGLDCRSYPPLTKETQR